MKRNVKDLQDAVNTIQIKEAMQREIIQNVQAGKKKRRVFPNVAAAAALVVILSAALSVPVRALVSSFIQERMERMPKGERTALVEDLYRQEAGADSFSREYTEEERRRMSELVSKYREGTFPEGELAQVEGREEAEQLGFCFMVPDRTFYLPDRELTEEELLQIIDFYAKRDYAVTERYEEEFAEEIIEQEESEEQKKEEVVAAGGITEEEAVELAQEWLTRIYGITGEGLELNHYFSDDVLVADKTGFYHVNWTDYPNREYYYFYIDAQDGSLTYAKNTSGYREAERPAASEAEALLPELKQSAVAMAEEQLQQTYQEAYYAYYSVNDTLSKYVMFTFVQEDGQAFVLTYYWDGTFYGFQKSRFITYQEKYEDLKASVEKAESGEVHLCLEKMN